ncbi:MAG: MFS transporter [Candidatus Nanopelagicales bacterium]
MCSSSWITAVAVLNGAIWRLPAGIIADRRGGRIVMTVMLAATAIPAFLVSHANSYTQLLIYAFLVGLAGNSFSVGIAWAQRVVATAPPGFRARRVRGRQRGRLGHQVHRPGADHRGAGSRPARRVAPGRLALRAHSSTCVLLLIMAAVTWFVAPHHDIVPGQGRSLASHAEAPEAGAGLAVQPLLRRGVRRLRRAGRPGYPSTTWTSTTRACSHAALLTALFIFPASLLRPVGGWISDRIGARKVMYATFLTMLVTTGILMMPYGHIVINRSDGGTSEILPWSVGVGMFTLLVFLTGCAMGIGKAAVFKHIPEYFPHDVGAVGGLVGSIGALGGFFLPPLFAYAAAWSGAPQATFGVLFLVTLLTTLWMHFTVVHMLHRASPDLANKFEHEGVNA